MPTRPEQAADVLLEEQNIVRPPIPVDAIARLLGAHISYEPFDGNVSGMLYRKGGRVVIGVNTSHPEVRQRFTIAHEIGHWRLHGNTEVFVDHLVRVDFRDDRASSATDLKEIQANAFAAELLMPATFIVSELRQRGPLASDGVEELVDELAGRFAVSKLAMEYRLVNLGFRGHV